MATYLNGVTDYIPQIQPFKPDFNFFQSALEKKQLQYQAGYDKVNSVYTQLLNSPLMRQANKDRRQNLFNQIDSEIKRLSGVDLSLSENVQQAGKLFDPLINDKYFRTDMVFTKQYQGQLGRADQLRRNPDPKSDEKWWEEGVSALHYQANDFANSSDEESLNFNAPRYVPFINTAEKLWQFAKDNDLNPTTISFNGGYIWTYQNGKQAIPTIQNVFSSILGNDSRVKDMFRTQAYLDRKNTIQQTAAQFNGDEGQAEQAYLKDKISQINQYYKAVNGQDEEKANQANTKKKVIEKAIRDKGVDPLVDKDLIAIYQNTSNDQAVQAAVLDKNKSVLTDTDFMSYDPTDLQSMRQRVEGAMSSFLMDGMANKVATDYAMAKFKPSVEVDPYAKMQVEHKYKMAEMKEQFNYDVIKKLMDIDFEKKKNEGDAVPGFNPSPEYEDGILTEVPGAGGVVSETQNVLARNDRQSTSLTNNVVSYSRNSAQEFLAYQNQIIKDPNATAEQKNYAEQSIKNVLGEYQVTEQEGGYTFEKDAPTNWGAIGSGLSKIAMAPANFLLGPLGMGTGMESVRQGASEFWQGAAGNEQVEVKGKTTKTSGYAMRNSDGTYRLADLTSVPGHDINGSDNYIGNIQQKINDYVNQNLSISRDANAVAFKTKIDKNKAKVDINQQVVNAIADVNAQNNTKILTLLGKEANVPGQVADLFMNKSKTKPLTENEFIAAYLEKQKKNAQKTVYDGFNSSTVPLSPEEWTADRQQFTIDEAQDAYEDLTEAYETLSKTSDLGLQTYDEKLGGDEGINSYFTKNAYYGFDAANFKNNSYGLAMDFFRKDFLPNITSPTFMDEKGVKVVAGVSGLDMTADEYAETPTDPKAAMLLKTFLASASMNYGGKTGENQVRPTGAFTVSAIAANDANKVAMTWDLSPEWVAKHAGTENNKGVAWDMQQNMAEGKGTNQITFFMDADKAKSSPFTSMQATYEEMLMNLTGNLSVNAYSDMGGYVNFTRNSDGSHSYTGIAKSVDSSGNFKENPISGNDSTDITALSDYWAKTMQDISTRNMTYVNTLRDNSTNKINDPNVFAQQ